MISPGSPQAKAQGCICCEIKNNYGVGTSQFDIPNEPTFIISMSCIVHGVTTWRSLYRNPDNNNFGDLNVECLNAQEAYKLYDKLKKSPII